MDKKLNLKPMIESLQKMTATPESKFDGAGYGTIVSVSPLRFKVGNVEIPESLLERSPFCQRWNTVRLKHKHIFTDKNDGKDSSGDVEDAETSEEILDFEFWRDLQVGDEVCYMRTNDSQKYLLLWRKEMFD